MKLTKRSLETAVRERRAVYLWAESPSGFGCRIRASGSATFIFDYRPGGGRSAPKRRVSIGSPLSLSIQAARDEALKIAAEVAKGADPARARAEQRRQRALAPNSTMATLAPLFVSKHHRAKGNRGSDEVLRVITRDAVRVWGPRQVGEITSADVSRLIEAVVQRGAPTGARKLYVALHRFFRWCVEHGFIVASPMPGAAKPPPERPRDRVLDDVEVAALWRASTRLDYPWKQFVQLLILTGGRRNEIAAATWEEFDLGRAEWTLPAHRSKNDRPHLRHISPQVHSILTQLPRVAPLLFTTTMSTPISGYSKLRRRVQALIEEEARSQGTDVPTNDWTWHDLRRSMVTWIAGAGFPPHVADRLLGHSTGTISGVAAVYQRAAFLPERKAALLAWNDHVEQLVAGVPNAGNVVQLKAHAG